MAFPVYKSDSIYTYKDYLSWSDDERWEIIDGKPVAMSPSPTPEHQMISVRLLETLLMQKQKMKNCTLIHAPVDVLLVDSEDDYSSGDSIRTVVQPDILILCDSSKMKKRGIEGAPDLIIEIVSPSTVSRDMTLKRDLYEKHGVREYWIVQPGERIVIVYILTDTGFSKGSVFTENDRISLNIFSDCEVDLRSIFPEIQE